MALYKHKRTGVLYHTICSAFNVETQEHQWVYANEKGQVFSRGQIKFAANFELIEANPQRSIVPKEPHE